MTTETTTDLHPLVVRILAVRQLMLDMEREVFGTRWGNPRRQELAKQSLFLDGLEEAARLALTAEQLAPLGE